jgi:hypothetical protein
MSYDRLVIMSLNGTLLCRDTTMKESNKNIIVRPCVKEWLVYLWKMGIELAFYSNMTRANAYISVKILLKFIAIRLF